MGGVGRKPSSLMATKSRKLAEANKRAQGSRPTSLSNNLFLADMGGAIRRLIWEGN